jgi:hypothetical protein
MREIDLNDYMSSDNVWARRILGLEPFQQKRDTSLVEKTYSDTIWGERLEANRADPEGLRSRLLNPDSREVITSRGDKIVALSMNAFDASRVDHMDRVLQHFSHAPEVCELGCGYGANLIKLGARSAKRFYGGDYAHTAVELGGLLKLDVRKFDYYRPESYEFIRLPSTLMTVHSIEQIPDATPFLDAVRQLRDRIDVIVHFEPLYRPDRQNLIGLIRNRYAEINDYNRNLLASLQAAADVEILSCEYDVFGVNPLNPTSVLVWRFRE